MNVSFNTRDLADAFKNVRTIFSKGPKDKDKDKDNNTGCLIASKKNGTVTLESAASGLYAKIDLSAEVEESGRVVINRDYVAGIRFKHKTTNLKAKDGGPKLYFKSGNLKGDVNVTQDFDEIEAGRPMETPDIIAEVPAGILRGGIKRVMFSSNDEENPHLNLTLRFKGKKLVLIANDSYRAAVFNTKLEEEIKCEDITIPIAFISSVVGSLQPDEMVGLGLGEKNIRIRGSNIDVFHPQLQDEKKVDIEEAIKGLESMSPWSEFMVNVAEAHEALAGAASVVPASLGTDTRMEVALGESKAVVKVESAISKSQCNFPISNVSTRELEEEEIRAVLGLDEEDEDGNPIEIEDSDRPDTSTFRVSSQFILEFLHLLGDGEVLVRNWSRQVLLRSEQYGTTLVMPQLS